jgi:hypothetical protein
MGAIRARESAYQDLKDRGENALTSEAIAAIVLSAAATEAFVNELPVRIRNAIDRGDKIPTPMVTCAVALDELESANAKTTSKYQIAALTLSGAAFDTGARPYQGFEQLYRLRNAVMHPKPDPEIKKLLTEYEHEPTI